MIAGTTQLLFCRAAVEMGYPPDQLTTRAAALAILAAQDRRDRAETVSLGTRTVRT